MKRYKRGGGEEARFVFVINFTNGNAQKIRERRSFRAVFRTKTIFNHENTNGNNESVSDRVLCSIIIIAYAEYRTELDILTMCKGTRGDDKTPFRNSRVSRPFV